MRLHILFVNGLHTSSDISVKEYKSLAESLTEDQFGKKTYPAKFSDDRPITALMITPCIHYTMGGLEVLQFLFSFFYCPCRLVCTEPCTQLLYFFVRSAS